MHSQARDGFRRMLLRSALVDGRPFRLPTRILDLGGANINGDVHDLFSVKPRVLDIEIGPGIDIVADARDYVSVEPYDVIMTTELLEHVDGWRAVVDSAFQSLARPGWFIGTAASTGRGAHGARGAPRPGPGEHYGNVPAVDLGHTLSIVGFVDIDVEYNPRPGDVYWSARRPD